MGGGRHIRFQKTSEAINGQESERTKSDGSSSSVGSSKYFFSLLIASRRVNCNGLLLSNVPLKLLRHQDNGTLKLVNLIIVTCLQVLRFSVVTPFFKASVNNYCSPHKPNLYFVLGFGGLL